jgi:hypothetical protein
VPEHYIRSIPESGRRESDKRLTCLTLGTCGLLNSISCQPYRSKPSCLLPHSFLLRLLFGHSLGTFTYPLFLFEQGFSTCALNLLIVSQ